VVKCHEIIQEWGEIILDSYQRETMLFMDSYYLQEESRKWLKENGIKYI